MKTYYIEYNENGTRCDDIVENVNSAEQAIEVLNNAWPMPVEPLEILKVVECNDLDEALSAREQSNKPATKTTKATKINRNNARERINEMLSSYEKRQRDNHFGGQAEYYVMSQAQYDEVFENILKSCNKEMAKYIERYTDSHPHGVAANVEAMLIRTWSQTYAMIQIVG